MTTAPALVPHVVLVPFPAQGHINPFSSLAHLLAASGISVTLVHSPRTHSSSFPTTSAETPADGTALHNSLYTPIRIEIMPDGTNSAQRFSMDAFRASIPVMTKGLEDIMRKLMQEDNPPCCLITEGILVWCHDIAVKCGLPRVDLWSSSASVFALGIHTPELIALGYLPVIDKESLEKTIDIVPGLSSFRVADLPKVMRAEEGLDSPAFEFCRSLFASTKSAERILINTIYELESEVVDALRRTSGIRVDPVGPLFLMSSRNSSTAPSTAHSSLLQEDTACLTWLDQQQASSVLYISFGSVATVEADAFKELAHGLEASGQKFLWVIRPDAVKDEENTTVEELLPQGFIERTRGKGLVISWAPQLAVLAHPSVCAFLTHCGWNSVMESLSNGIPMLGFPQAAEQNTNCKFVVQDWKVGMPLLGEDAQKAERVSVQRAVSAIMEESGEGGEVRRRAGEWRDIALKAVELHGSSNSSLQKLVGDLRDGHFISKPLIRLS